MSARNFLLQSFIKECDLSQRGYLKSWRFISKGYTFFFFLNRSEGNGSHVSNVKLCFTTVLKVNTMVISIITMFGLKLGISSYVCTGKLTKD